MLKSLKYPENMLGLYDGDEEEEQENFQENVEELLNNLENYQDINSYIFEDPNGRIN